MFHENSPSIRERVEEDPEGFGSAQEMIGLHTEGYEDSGAPVRASPSDGNYESTSKASPEAPAGQNEDAQKKVLLFTVFNPSYPITVDVLNQICKCAGGTVARIVIFRKHGVQAMVEFDTEEGATSVKESLHGRDIYNGCCTLKIDWGKSTRLIVGKNDHDSWDYTTNDTSAKLQPLLSVPKIGGGAPCPMPCGPGLMPWWPRPQVNMYGAQPHGPPPRQFMPFHGPAPGVYGQQPPPAAFAAGYDDGSGISMLQQGSVLMVYGLNSEKMMNCQRIFNLFCLYGNVVRVKFMKSKDGIAMVQLGDNASCERAIKNINGSFAFGHKMVMGYSKQAFIQDVPDPLVLPDGTVSFMDFMGDRNNRFTTPEAAAKNRILPASKVLYFFNAPPGIQDADLRQVFTDCDVRTPTKIKIFPSKSNRSSTGLLEWENKGECVEALVAANHFPIPNPNGNNPFILKFCFSDA